MKKRVLSGILVLFMMLLVVFSARDKTTDNAFIPETDIPLSDGDSGSESALEFVSKMGAGWNLGNSFCCFDGKNYGEQTVAYYEKLWGNPITTKTTIDAIKAKGFKTVRIPVTYRNHIDANNHIDVEWLTRLKEVVDYVIEDDMYCIINLHHENWLVADADKQTSGEEKLEAVWQQIAEYFSDYGSNLIFEGFNEVINSAGQWDSADDKSYAVVNAYNQTFVNTVRASGGNNLTRYLIVNTYAAKATKSVLNGFVLPQDTTENHLIVSAHIYDGMASSKVKMDDLYRYYVKHGIPVIIGEWGTTNSSTNTEAKRIAYAQEFLSIATNYCIPCIWWDDGGVFSSSSAVSNYAILQRKTGNWYFDSLANEIVNSSQLKYEKITGIKTVEDIFNMKGFSNWKSGDYNYSTGKYSSNSTRLCLVEEQKVLANATYTAIINNPNYHILVRLMNSSGKLVRSYNLANMDTFTVNSDDYTVRVSIYNYTNSNVCRSYEEYATLFQNGFEARIEADIEEVESSAADADIFGMKEFTNWISGNYSCNTGKYAQNSSRICLADYVEIVPGQTYSVNISDENYCILIRMLDENNKMIESKIIKNGGCFTVGSNEVKAGISLYNAKSNSITFADYEQLFANGFYSYIQIK